MTVEGATCRQPLLVTDDPSVLDAVLHVSAVVAVELQVVADLPAAAPFWASAPVVLLGPDTVAAYAAGALPARPGVAVVTAGADAAGADAAPAGTPVFRLPDELALLAVFVEADAPEPGALVAVVGGRGGAGASTTAVALAVTATATGRRVMLVDADPYGGGLDLALGAEERAGLRWPDLDALHGPVASAVLVDTLPRAHGITLLSYGRDEPCAASPAAMRAVLDAGLRAHDLVVADLGRVPDPARDVVLSAADLVLLVVPAEVRAAAAATRVAADLAARAADVRVVVRGPAPSGLDARTVARLLGLPSVGWLRSEPGIAPAAERGEPPARSGRGPLAELARRVLGEVTDPRRVA